MRVARARGAAEGVPRVRFRHARGVPEREVPELDVPSAVDEVIRTRRTSLLVDPDDPVPEELLALLVELATWAPKFTAESVVSQTLPGYFYDQVGADQQLLQSFWVADKSKVNGLIDRMLEGQTVAVVQEGSVVVQAKSPGSSSSASKQNIGGDSSTSSGDDKSSIDRKS